MSILVNKSKWDSLTGQQREVLRKAGARAEDEAAASFAQENKKDIDRQAAAGIQVIKLEGAIAKIYLDKAYEAGWAGIIRQSPEHGPKLRQLFSKPD